MVMVVIESTMAPNAKQVDLGRWKYSVSDFTTLKFKITTETRPVGPCY